MHSRIAAVAALFLLTGGLTFMMNSCSSSDKPLVSSETSGTVAQETETAKPDVPAKDISFCCPDNLTYYLREEPFESPPSPELKVSLARNEREGAQVILNCPEEFKEVRISAGDLKSADGNTIPSSDIEIFRQHYIEITQTSTEFSKPGFYPDALVPISDANREFTVGNSYNRT